MGVAATSTAPVVPRICSSTSTCRRQIAGRIAFGLPNVLPIKSSRSARIVHVSASSGEEANSSNRDPEEDQAFLSQEDLDYLVKLGTGSVVGAAAIKYGSVIFPEITRPNITQALLMIFFPVIVAVLLLSRPSRSN